MIVFTGKLIDLGPIKKKYFHDDLSIGDVKQFSKSIAFSNKTDSVKTKALNDIIHFLKFNYEAEELRFWPFFYLLYVFQESGNYRAISGVLKEAKKDADYVCRSISKG